MARKMKAKAIYVYSRTEKKLEVSGEAQKAKMQKKALEKNGVECEVLYHCCCRSFNRIKIRLPFTKIYNGQFTNVLLDRLDEEISSIYFRKYVFDKSFINLLKKIKQKNSAIKIILEIPTYPYELEWNSFFDKPLLWKDKAYRKKLHAYVDKIVTFSKDEIIFDIPCIQTSNGIDVSSIKKIVPQNNGDNTINLLGVAYVEKWHGYDRILYGLANYYKDKNIVQQVVFHIVGNGSEINNLKKICKQLNLEGYVVFHGALHGEELNNMFNKCHIAIGSLGLHRIGLYDGYALKLREYTARGIPFIYGYNDALLEEHNLKYMLKVENDDTAIDVNKIVDFYTKIYQEDRTVIIHNMSDYAQNYLTWIRQMRPVAEYILGI